MSKIAEINELAEKLYKWKNAYYAGTPKVSDQIYDGCELRLKELSPKHPVLAYVGADVTQETENIEYAKAGVHKMLSLDKVYDLEGISKFLGNHKYVAMYKLDGLSIRIVYRDKGIYLAHTRGDGECGDIITTNVFFIGGVFPTKWEYSEFEVRGEVIMHKEDLEKLNALRAKNNEILFANPRNAAAGSLKLKNSKELLGRNLNFYAYAISVPGKAFDKSAQLDLLEKMGFKTPRVICTSIEECIKNATENRDSLPFEIDGLVFALDSKEIRQSLGETSHHPRYELAYKFASSFGETFLKEIRWEITRYSKLTPIGILEPIELSGASVSRVTLHNAGNVKEKKIAVNKRVNIGRAGDVIPYFGGVIDYVDEDEVKIPDTCPSCGKPLKYVEPHLYCVNMSCRGVQEKIIKFYVSKDAVDIKGFGDVLVSQLFDAGLVKTPVDIYKLTKEDLLKLDRMGEKKADKILDAISGARTQTYRTFIRSLGIEGVGKDVVDKIVDKLDRNTNYPQAGLSNIPGVGSQTIVAICLGLTVNAPLIEELRKYITIKD